MEIKWLIAYGFTWLVEFALFGMQRATLLISRRAGIHWKGGGQLLLPSWYPATWIAIIGKWGILLAMAILLDWKIALGLAIVGYILGVVIPIPYSLYKGIFRKRAVYYFLHKDRIIGQRLLNMLDNAPF